MIGKITLGKSFHGIINYCLYGKQGEKKDVSEIIHFNQCFGDKNELVEQMREVRTLNRRIEKPVWHTSISFHKHDNVSIKQLIEISEAFAEKFDLHDNQYIVVQHHDTPEHPHIHFIANRVGFDGKANKTNLNYKKMTEFNRRMEKQYGFKEVLSPKKFLNKEQQMIPRHDTRKELLKKTILELIPQSSSLDDFKNRITKQGYEIQAGRGIAFTDDKHVRIKGSEVGFSISKLQKAIENSMKNETQFIQRTLNKSRNL